MTTRDNVGQSLTTRKRWRISVTIQAAAWLQGQLDRLKLTHEEAAELTSVPRQTISAVLNQRNEPTDDTLQRLAKGFGVPVPRIEKVLVFGGATATVIDHVRLAQATLEAAARLLGAPTPSDPLVAREEALVQEEEQLTGRGKRGARGRGKKAG